MTGIKASITSNRKRKRRKFNSAKKIEMFLKRSLVMHTWRIAKKGIKQKLGPDKQRVGALTVETDSIRGWILFKAEMKLPNPGDIRPDTIWAAKQESWLRGDTVVMELPEGILYKIHEELGEKAKEMQREQGKKNKTAVQQVQQKLHEATKRMVNHYPQFRVKIKQVLDKVLEDLSLADV